jgi:hypothetical protein
MRLMILLFDCPRCAVASGVAHAQILIFGPRCRLPLSRMVLHRAVCCGQPYGTNLPPFVNRQPVQGLSGMLAGPRRMFHFLVQRLRCTSQFSRFGKARPHAANQLAYSQRGPGHDQSRGLGYRKSARRSMSTRPSSTIRYTN